MTELKKSINIFLLDENLEDFIKNDERESPIEELDSKLVYLIVDPMDKIVWIWNGAEANIRMKFIATQKAPLIRDEYGIDFKIIGVDENEEPTEFKDFLGLD
jgi:hypothetical protein